MRRSIIWILLGLFGLMCHRANCQGCSDAGVCSIGSLNPENTMVGLYSTIGLSTSFGLGEADGFLVPIWTTQLESQLRLSPTTYANLRIPFQVAHGNLATTYGLGDIAVSISQVLQQNDIQKTTFTLGALLPTNDANKTDEGRGLPMLYQTSLGSYDLIVGVSHNRDGWQFAMGYQHPFNRNQNSFLHSSWPDDESALAYFESNRLLRGDDLIFRVGRRFTFDRSSLYIGILPIFRLQKDEIIKEDQIVALEGSRGLTINLNLRWVRPITDRTDFMLIYGNPVVWRQVRADGLTRVVVVTAAFSWKITTP